MHPQILLLHDAFADAGRPDANDTLLEAEAIAQALGGIGYDTSIAAVGHDLTRLEALLAQRAPRLVVNLVESIDGRGQLISVVPALLESLGVPFTGCSANALGVTSDKVLAKQQLVRAGVSTPAVFGADADDGPWIVKSVWEHASLGIDDSSVVRGATAVARVIEARRAQHGGDWFAERFVPGRELNVALIAATGGVRVLPVAEIRFDGFPVEKPAIVGYAAKWHTDSFEYRNTVRSFAVESELGIRAENLARDCWELFGLTGYARVDLRVDAGGEPWVLEINANPCLSPDAGFAAALGTAGIEYKTAIGWLVDDALRRTDTSPRRFG
ncbi:MAG: ATP-grasp domain-containing protein [Gammaproteobacteria bacterium]